MSVVCIHPKWLEQAGAGDIVRHFQLRGFTLTNPAGSRRLHVVPIPRTPLDETLALFRPAPQRR